MRALRAPAPRPGAPPPLSRRLRAVPRHRRHAARARRRRRSQVRVEPASPTLLPALGTALDGAVALITGRAIADVDRLSPDCACRSRASTARAARRRRHAAHPCPRRPQPRSRACAALLHDVAARHQGLLLEDKGRRSRSTTARRRSSPPYVHRAVRDGCRESTGTTATAAARQVPARNQARGPRQGRGDPGLHGGAAVPRPPAGVRRRRPQRRVRLRRGRRARRLVGQGGPGRRSRALPAARRRRGARAGSRDARCRILPETT